MPSAIRGRSCTPGPRPIDTRGRIDVGEAQVRPAGSLRDARLGGRGQLVETRDDETRILERLDVDAHLNRGLERVTRSAGDTEVLRGWRPDRPRTVVTTPRAAPPYLSSMSPVSFLTRLETHLRHCDGQTDSRDACVSALSPWMTADQAGATIERAIADTTTRIRPAHGRKLVYYGSENRSGPALYKAVGNVFSKHWGPDHLGLKVGTGADEIVVKTLTARSKGDWTMPDLVVFAHPRRKKTATSPREIHCFEIEQRDGFKIQSVYQAYEQARGADYAWVFAHASELDPRIEKAADELRVGVVIFDNPNSGVTYSHPKTKSKIPAIPATRRDISPREREAFLSRVHLEDVG